MLNPIHPLIEILNRVLIPLNKNP
jgi:hypothetical protein